MPAKPPSLVTVGAHSYTVTVDATRAEAHDALGVCLTKLDEIVLSPLQGESTMRVTVLHELIHALVFDSGDHDWATEELEEKLCTVLAPRLLDLLRRNPRLLAYLVSA